MPDRRLLAAIAVLTLSTAARAVDPSDLKPGLVASYGSAGNASLSITRLEPTVALALKPGETPHPRMARSGNTVWSGYINVLRPGPYTFSATLQGGSLTVRVGDRPVFEASATQEPLTKSGNEVTLDGGVQPFLANFNASGDAARVELFWKGPGFVKEPLPNQFLGHLPREKQEALSADIQLEHGRFRFEELGCINCHKPAADDRMARGLVERSGPNLTEIGKRAFPGWITAWLTDPTKLRPQTTMPALFTHDDQGTAEAYAVTQYLLSLRGNAPLIVPSPATIPSNDVRQSIDRGRVLYSVAGCAACHQEPKASARNDEDDREPLKPGDYFASLGTQGPSAKYLLGAVGSKTRPELLAAYLQNPLKTNPHGRMPQMSLNSQEATDLARFLCRNTNESIAAELPAAPKLKPLAVGKVALDGQKMRDELEKLEKLPVDKQWSELGRTLVVTKGCVNCHAIEPAGKAVAPLGGYPSLARIEAAGSVGCIGNSPSAAKVPIYKLEAEERIALAAFLKDGLHGAGTPAPAYSARVALRRFNCLNCHGRDGEGGISTELANDMRLLEKAQNADDVRPPLLTGIGHKSRTSWLKSVLVGGGRARPWMQLRMPQYGEALVGFLPEALAALEGTIPDDSVYKVTISGAKVQMGKQVVGKSGLGCISCHDIGGYTNTGTRGPDLSTINQRVRYEWYERWLSQPLRMAPGTRMPQAFLDGKSALSTVANGDAKTQAEAMWAYLSLGPGLPLPEGLEPPKGLIIAAKERPELLRTFMPDAGSKGIAVGYPGGTNLAFSADQCRLAYAWAGNFLDASPVWDNRGGAPAKILGPKFWSAPSGHPWGLTSNPSVPPDFAARANNPAFGLPLPLEPPRIYSGARAVNFDGYSIDTQGRPTFRYTLRENEKDAILKISETPVPISSNVGSGLIRQFGFETPANYRAWFLAGQSSQDPRAFALNGERIASLDLKSPEPMVTATGSRLVLSQDGGKALVFEARRVPEGTVWRVTGKPGAWQVMLRFPETASNAKGSFELVMWSLPKDDDDLLKDLLIQP